jgi:hypothetical protein
MLMPKLDVEFKNQIKSLSKADLEEIVIRVAGKNKEIYDFLIVNYFDTQYGEKDLFEEAQNEIRLLFIKKYKGFSEELQLAAMIEACVKRINEFQKICKNKNLEPDLILMILDEVFTHSANSLGTCFTKFDYRVGLLLKRLITLVTNKLHPDFMLEYRKKINDYLQVLHKTSTHLDFIYAMPKSI